MNMHPFIALILLFLFPVFGWQACTFEWYSKTGLRMLPSLYSPIKTWALRAALAVAALACMYFGGVGWGWWS